jgi:putative glutamine amidotransferase
MKNILITQRASKDKYGCNIDFLEYSYINYLEKFNIRLIVIPNSTTYLEKYFDLNIQGIILTGGNDVNPGLYGEKNKKSSDISNDRDRCEKKILAIAVEKRIPLLGICRGLQFSNVFFGGKINQDLHQKCGDKHLPARDHPVILKENTLIGYLKSQEVLVNSYHNQAVFPEDLSSELKTFAFEKKSGLIEGIYHPQLPLAAVQWHPERETAVKLIDKLLIESFLERKLFWEK